MPTSLGAHNPRIAHARELLTRKGRKERGEFAFEGPTLLEEALHAGVAVRTVYATAPAYEAMPQIREAERRGVEILLIDERSMRRISDVETPAGVVAVAPLALQSAQELLAEGGLVLALADLNDPGNAGTLLRSAEAFGARGVLFGSRGVDPHNPKVVRSAMGALFRLPLAVTEPQALAAAAAGWEVTGLTMEGGALDALAWGAKSLLVVGSERRGLDAWAPLCTRTAAIPMAGRTESLNAAVAGSIALYEAAKRLHS